MRFLCRDRAQIAGRGMPQLKAMPRFIKARSLDSVAATKKGDARDATNARLA